MSEREGVLLLASCCVYGCLNDSSLFQEVDKERGKGKGGKGSIVQILQLSSLMKVAPWGGIAPDRYFHFQGRERDRAPLHLVEHDQSLTLDFTELGQQDVK